MCAVASVANCRSAHAAFLALCYNCFCFPSILLYQVLMLLSLPPACPLLPFYLIRWSCCLFSSVLFSLVFPSVGTLYQVVMLACSVLQRMLRRNPLAALALNQPSMRSMSCLSIADDVPFTMDDTTQANKDLPDGTFACLSHRHLEA